MVTPAGATPQHAPAFLQVQTPSVFFASTLMTGSPCRRQSALTRCMKRYCRSRCGCGLPARRLPLVRRESVRPWRRRPTVFDEAPPNRFARARTRLRVSLACPAGAPPLSGATRSCSACARAGAFLSGVGDHRQAAAPDHRRGSPPVVVVGRYYPVGWFAGPILPRGQSVACPLAPTRPPADCPPIAVAVRQAVQRPAQRVPPTPHLPLQSLRS